MPEMVIVLVSLKDELITHVIAGTHARIRICTILLLQLWIEFLVDDSHLYLMLHNRICFSKFYLQR